VPAEWRSGQVSEDELDLLKAFATVPEREAADWASACLALVVHLANDAGWATTVDKARERAIMMLAVRLFRAIRATMAVLSVGYEVEGRAMARLVIETRARLLEVTKDETPETGRQWLEGKPKTKIRAAVRGSAPDIDQATANRLYGGLSQDSHADVGGILRSLTRVDEDRRADVRWGPHRTDDTSRSLLLCANFAAEAATLLAAEAGVDHSHRDALIRYLRATEEKLQKPA